MAGRKENLKALFTNTRSRVIIVFTIILLIVAVAIGLTKFLTSGRNAVPVSSANVPGTPGIQSIPGALDPTAQYANLQEAQNLNQAQQALHTGGSAIPTIVRSQELGAGVESVGAQGGQGGVGFETLAREDQAGSQRSLWIQDLQNESCSKATVDKVVGEGAALPDLKNACSCVQLKDNGYKAEQLQQICSCKELKAAGFNALQLKAIGFSAGRLRLCGFDACELRNAGFSAQQMKDGGFSDGELKGAGFSPTDISRASGLPDGITENDVRKAGCQVAALERLRASGVSAAAIRRISGCSASQLKAAGFTAAQLRDAGFTAADLKKAGFTAAQLRQAGFNARDLLNAGFTPGDLANAGFTPDQIMAAESELPPGISPADVKSDGCDVDALKKERLAGVSAKLIKQYAGCSAKALKDAGFTDADLQNAGFTPAQIGAASAISDAAIRAAGCDPAKLKQLFNEGVSAKRIHDLNGCSAAALKAAGFDAKSLLDAGFTPQDLLAAGFTPQQIQAGEGVSDDAIKAAGCDPAKLKVLFNQGVSAKRIHELNGCSAAALKAAGFDAKSLLAAGFTPEDLAAAGLTPDEIRAALTTSNDAIRAASCDPAKLRKLYQDGVSAKQIHDLNGCSAAALKAAGYDAKSLLAAGFTPKDLLAAGFTPAQLTQAGLNRAAIIAAGRVGNCNVDTLKKARAAGISASSIRQTLGCNADALKAAGYTAAELKAAGFTAAELKNAGFSAAELKAAGFTAKELHDAGFSAAQLKAAGFSASELKDAGFSAAQLKDAGFSASQLKAAGFSAKDLRDAGFTASELKAAGFSAKDLKDAGFSANDLRGAGFSPNDLKDAGYTDAQIKSAGFSKAELVAAGIEGSQVAGLESPNQQGITSTMPSIPGAPVNSAQSNAIEKSNAAQLQEILKRQNQQLADQKYQQRITQRTSEMMSVANQDLQTWKKVTTQAYAAGSAVGPKKVAAEGMMMGAESSNTSVVAGSGGAPVARSALVKTGDILFAVIDTAVNSDEPGPILATIVSGKLKGAKLIGSFNLPSNANKMIISFNTLSVPGAPKTVSVSAVAIDANTARTALSSDTNHHYLLRYGSLFASAFLEGFGNAFQSANTTVTVGAAGTGAVTIQNGIGRSTLENAVIGLATLGKNWGQVAQQTFNTPITVQVYSGTAIGVLFTQDLTAL